MSLLFTTLYAGPDPAAAGERGQITPTGKLEPRAAHGAAAAGATEAGQAEP